MASEEFHKLMAFIAANPAPVLSHEEMRAQMSAFGRRAKLPEGMTSEALTGTPVPARLLTPAGEDGAANRGLVLFAHGGGFTLGSIDSHAHVAGWLAQAAGRPALIFDYRLAPEHPYPAAPDDFRAIYRWALEQGHAPGDIAFAGDSAGANLALSLVSNGGLARLAALAMLSPSLDLAAYLDLDLSSVAEAGVDAGGIADGFRAYAGEHDAAAPGISPSRGEPGDLPPMFIQLAEGEVFAPPVLDFAERASAAGNVVEVDVWPEMTHDWHWYAPRLPEARAALDRAGDFLRRHLS